MERVVSVEGEAQSAEAVHQCLGCYGCCCGCVCGGCPRFDALECRVRASRRR